MLAQRVIYITANESQIEFPWRQLARLTVGRNFAESMKTFAEFSIRSYLPQLMPILDVRYDAVFKTESEGPEHAA